MTAIGPGLGMQGVLALRNEILQRSQALQPTTTAQPTPAPTPAGGFGNAMSEALKAVNGLQSESSAQGAAWERGETHDIASVMLSRQKASIAFEATLQGRNRLLSAYRDIMNMPV
ncbi:flagellar hook-basal body complex protein FliE [Sandaracinobacteroides hominis]|uniref:flagellar hook-basal body complex protein FliE n=1 Tax=Sandaracinobacteroides hominis TaxID=2780086 RepID=UPI001F1BA47E|nr:flagellar hook-basal body complex protein FliE [Sandaracinobacteroides hominis]